MNLSPVTLIFSRRGGVVRRVIAGSVATVLTVTLAQMPPMPTAAAAAAIRQHVQKVDPVPGHAATAKQRAGGAMPAYHAPAPVWPEAMTATVSVPGPPSGLGSDALGRTSVVGSTVRAGALPVYLAQATPHSVTSGRGSSAATAPASVTVDVLDHGAAADAGPAMLLRLSHTSATSTTLALGVDYSGFATAFGADWAQRLRLEALPAGCQGIGGGCTPTPLRTGNDGHTVTAIVDLPAAQDAATAGALTPANGDLVVALAASASSGSGDYSATPLAPSSTWSAGGNSGGFSWSYGLRVPPGLGGPEPDIAFGYSSQAVDGEMAATDNQPSMIGEGFSYSPGQISRTYVGCADDMGNGGNNTSATGDECWRTDNATLTLNGQSSELLYNSTDGSWHARSESGWRIKRYTGATNGDNDGEYWIVTTTDGTQYFFGLNRLPGYTGTAPANKVTNSVYAVPVYGNNSAEPCHQSAYASSSCAQAWQWNLDYVQDTHGNTESFWYAPETNRYGANNSSTNLVTYTRGGYLTKIDYGTDERTVVNSKSTDTDETATSAPMTVVFTSADRCLSSCSTHDSAHWPDVPWDQDCSTGSTCTNTSPTFWTTKRLASVKTRAWNAATSAYKDVESWTLSHTFPDPGDGTAAGLWLSSIAHAGLVGGTVTVPNITFTGTAMPNRVDTSLDNGLRPVNRPRLTEIVTESGEVIDINYSSPECVPGVDMPSAPDTNTKRCYPVRWTPPDLGREILDYFQKYVVSSVTEEDHTDTVPGSLTKTTTYTYTGTPAWHYADDDGLTKAKYRTWNQWRGYSTVQTITGVGAERTMTQDLYFRGMYGDKLSGGTRTDTVPDSKGLGNPQDLDQYAGMVRESTDFNGPTGAAIGGTVNDPWTSQQTATRTLDGVTVKAEYTGIADEHDWDALDHGRPDRWTDVHTDFDNTYGMPTAVTDYGDTAKTGDETCALNDYTRNTGGWIVDSVKERREYTMTCALVAAKGGTFTTDDIMSDTRTSYDSQAWGAAPTIGDPTKTEDLKTWSGTSGTYLTAETDAYDAYGRVVDTGDVDGIHATTAYTPSNGGPVTSAATTNLATAWVTTNDLEPAWGATVDTIDPNGRRTDITYDPLGRTAAVWLPGRSKATYPTAPSTSYAYSISSTAPSTVTAQTLNANGGYNTTVTLYDALLRPRQTQTLEAGTGGGRVVSDTFYDTAGRAYMNWGPYYAAAAPSTSLFLPVDGQGYGPSSDLLDQWTRTVYDGGARPIEADQNSKTNTLWRTLTGYTGDRTDVTPPAGGIATSTVTDIGGNTVELHQYHGGVATGSTDPSTYDVTTHHYDPKGQLDHVTNPAGNTWSYGYDLRGRQTSIVDPDTGSTQINYDDAGRVTSTTDGRGVTLAYAYNDPLKRKTGEYLNSTSGQQLIGYSYDQITNSRGVLTATSRYLNGDTTHPYTAAVTAFDSAGRPTTAAVTIPSTQTGLAGTYTYTNTYKADGSLATSRLSAIGGTGGLGIETLTYSYTNLDQPSTLSTTLGSTFVNSTSYDPYGRTGTTTLRNNAGKTIQIGDYWDNATGRLSRIWTTRENAPSSVSDLRYTYDNAGNITEADQLSPVAGAETQCYTTNYLDQLTQAWTPADGNCREAPTQANIGNSPAPYWTEWTLDPSGNRLHEIQHATSDTDIRYNYTDPTHPHELMSTSAGTTTTGNYSYTDSNNKNVGETTSRPGPHGTQTLTWDPEGHLATVADSTGTTSYLYDGSGLQLIETDPTGKTLYLPGQEVRVNTTGVLVSCTRFYTYNGQTIAQRSTAGVTWLSPDHQGTSQIAIDATTQNAAIRRYTPYGADRGTNPAWPNAKGYVGGTIENTGLINLGARQYDPTTGRFLSIDPQFDQDDPQSWNGYAYANNNPITNADPTGLTCIKIDGYNGPCGNQANTKAGKAKLRQLGRDERARAHAWAVWRARQAANRLIAAGHSARNRGSLTGKIKKAQAGVTSGKGISEDEYQQDEHIVKALDPDIDKVVKPSQPAKKKHWWDKVGHFVNQHLTAIVTVAAVIGAGACIVVSFGTCAVITAVVLAASAANNYYHASDNHWTGTKTNWAKFARAEAVDAVATVVTLGTDPEALEGMAKLGQSAAIREGATGAFESLNKSGGKWVMKAFGFTIGAGVPTSAAVSESSGEGGGAD